MQRMKLTVMSVMLLLFISGCIPAPLIIGGASGGAVYTTTSDHIKDTFNISKEQAFEVMIGIVAKEDGSVTVSSIADGKIEAKLGSSLLFVTIKPIDETMIEVSIRAKKHMELIPDKDTAVRIYRTFVKEVMQ
jgi:hypothetical protein